MQGTCSDKIKYFYHCKNIVKKDCTDCKKEMPIPSNKNICYDCFLDIEYDTY